MRLLTILILLCTAARMLAQHSSDTREYIPLITYWDKGDTLRYQMVKGIKSYSEGKLTDSTGRRIDFSLTVIDSTGSDYTIRYDSRSDDLLQEYGVLEKDLLEIMKRYPGIAMDYRIDSVGTFLGFENPDRLADMYREIFNLMAAQKLDAAEREAQKALFEQMTTPGFLLKAFEHIPTMHQFYGLQFARDSVLEYQEELRNLWDTSRPIVVGMVLQVRKEPEWNGLATLRQEYTLKHEAVQLLIQSMQTHAPERKLAPEEMEKFRIETGITYVFDPDFGYIYNIGYSRKMFFENELFRDEFYDLDIVH